MSITRQNYANNKTNMLITRQKYANNNTKKNYREDNPRMLKKRKTIKA